MPVVLEAEKDKEKDSPLGTPGGTSPADTLILVPLSLEPQENTCVLS